MFGRDRSFLLSLIGFLGASGLFGQSGGWLELGQTGMPPQILVYSENGTRWDFVDRTAPLRFTLKARGRCFEDYHMRNAYICAGHSGDGSCVEPAVDQDNRSYSADEGREWKVVSVSRQYLSPKLPVASAADMCNQALEARAAAPGAPSRQALVQRGFMLPAPEAYRAWFNLSCEKQTIAVFKDWASVDASTNVTADVQCIGSGDPQAGKHRLKPESHRLKPEAHRMAAEPGIKDAEIWINPKADAKYTGECPAKLRVGGELAYHTPEDDPVDVHYRYQVRQGRRSFSSPIFKATYPEPGKKNLNQWAFEIAPATASQVGGLAAPDAKPAATLDGEVELVVLGNVPGARSPSTSFSVTCAPGDAPVVDGGSLTAGREPPPAEVREGGQTSATRRLRTAARFGGFRVALPLRATGRTGLAPGSYVVEVPTQTIAPGDEIAMVVYATPGSATGGAPTRIPCTKVAKIEQLKIETKIAESRVLPDGGLQIRVEAPECRCALTGVVEPEPAQ